MRQYGHDGFKLPSLMNTCYCSSRVTEQEIDLWQAMWDVEIEMQHWYVVRLFLGKEVMLSCQ